MWNRSPAMDATHGSPGVLWPVPLHTSDGDCCGQTDAVECSPLSRNDCRSHGVVTPLSDGEEDWHCRFMELMCCQKRFYGTQPGVFVAL